MSEPLLKSQPGVYQFVWEPEQIGIMVDRIRDTRGTISAELTITSLLPATENHLHLTRINLLSTRERNELVRYLTQRVNTVEWENLIEQTCSIAVRKYREGEPVIAVGNLPKRERLKYRLSPLILENQPNLLYGPGGSAKSTFAIFCAVIVQLGTTHSGLMPIQGNVLYLDYETSQDEIDESVQMLKKGLKLDSSLTISYCRCNQPLADNIADIQRKVLEADAKLVITDSVGAACGGEPESAEVVLRYFMALRSLKVTNLSIDHVARKSEGMPFGSVYKINCARNAWEVKKAQEAGENEFSIGLFHRKVNTGKLLKPLGYRLHFEDGALSISCADIKEIPELIRDLPLREQIASVLRDGKMTPNDIAEELGKTDGNVRTQLNRYKDMFVKFDEGTWGLLQKG